MILRQYLQFIASCQSIEEVWANHIQQMSKYGFDRLIYGYTRYRIAESLGDPDDFVTLTNHGTDYTDEYIGNGLFHHAPMLKWAMEHDGACSWSVMKEMTENGVLTPAEQKVLDFNRRMGVCAGYTISFKAVSTRTKGAIGLTAQEGITQTEVDEIWAEHGRDIQLMNEIAHLKITTMPYFSPGRKLTPRQREALEWVGDGKTMQEIAKIMGLTPATVEKHLRLAREALSVETTAQAVMKAAFSNQMFVLNA